MKLTPDFLMDMVSACVLISYAYQDPHGAFIAALAYAGTLALGTVMKVGITHDRPDPK